VGAIVIGPCPQCQEFVAVFCGAALPLDKHTVLNGSPKQKREHLLAVLTRFLGERLSQFVTEIPSIEGAESAGEEADMPGESAPEALLQPLADVGTGNPQITEAEVDQFIRSDLPLLDNKHYFKAIFG
jgi:hypothetical protein